MVWYGRVIPGHQWVSFFQIMRWCYSTLVIDPSAPSLLSLIINTFNLPLCPTFFLLSFSGLFNSPYFLPHPYPQPFILRSLSFAPSTHLLSRCKAPPTWTLPAPANLQPPLLVPAPHAACLRLPPFLVPVRSPLFRPRPAPRFLSAIDGNYPFSVTTA